MSRRANGEGTIVKVMLHGKLRWKGTVSLGVDPTTGKRIRPAVYGKTQKEAREKLDEVRKKYVDGQKYTASRGSLADYLTRWLQDDVQINKAKKTHQEYELAVRRYIVPNLGSVSLAKLDAMRVQTWQAKMVADGFSNHQRKRALSVLRNALNAAVKKRLVSVNPCSAVTMPKVVKRDVVPLEPEQCKALFQSAEEHRIGDIIIVAAMTGLRKGELLALQWDCVNLAEGVLMVRRTVEEVAGTFGVKEPKSKTGRRAVTLGELAIQALKRRQKKAREEGFDPEYVPLVFPNTVGKLHRSSNFDRRVWHPIREAAKLGDDFVFHDLRHTQASLLLAAGVNMKVVQERLGHSDYSLTANTYSHLLQGAQADAVAKTDQFLKDRSKLVTQDGYTNNQN